MLANVVFVVLPTLVHDEPLELLKAVMVVPLRTRRTHVFGTVPVLLLELVVLPPVTVRRIHRKAFVPDMPIKICFEFAPSESRITTPTRDELPVFCRELILAMISPSPVRV